MWDNASIGFRRENYLYNQERYTYCIVSYNVGGKYVLPKLEIICGEDGLVKVLRFLFIDPGSMSFVIEKAKNNLLNNQIEVIDKKSYGIKFVNETKNHWGGVTKTFVAYRRGENEGNLVVVELKRKRGVELPCVVTVTHYYAFSKQSFIRQRKIDVGLSIVVDVRVVNNDFDVSWKGHFEHPSLALFEMFQQVARTWTWKWTACPHCAAQTHRQQFETETENDDEERNYLQQPMQIGGNILANQGVIKGNNNGNFFVNQLILGGGYN
jgi:hypothetical protein